jgi:hypothetical protein
MKCKKHKREMELATFDDYMLYPKINSEYFCLRCVKPEGLGDLLKEIYSDFISTDLGYNKNPFLNLIDKEKKSDENI